MSKEKKNTVKCMSRMHMQLLEENNPNPIVRKVLNVVLKDSREDLDSLSSLNMVRACKVVVDFADQPQFPKFVDILAMLQYYLID